MATLLMRTSDVSGADKVLFSPLVHHSRLQKVDQAANNQKSPDAGPGRNRSRKGKNGQKKQPQRGLGVAQLEKLRLQEQSKQEAACLASLQHCGHSLPPIPSSFAFSEALCVQQSLSRQVKDGMLQVLSTPQGIPAVINLSPAYGCRPEKCNVNVGSEYLDPNRGYGGNLSRSQSFSSAYPAHGPGFSILLRKADSEPSFSMISPMPEDPRLKLGISADEYCKSEAQESLNGTNEQNPASQIHDLSSIHMNSDKNTFYNIPSRFNPAEGSIPHIDEQQMMHPEANKPKELLCFFPSVQTTKKARPDDQNETEAYADYSSSNRSNKALPENISPASSGNLTEIELFDSSLGPPGMNHLRIHCMELPMVGNPAIGERPKELPSFQNYPGSQVWPYTDKASGRKRPWLGMQEDPRNLMHPHVVGLNPPLCEQDQHRNMQSGVMSRHSSLEPRKGTHYTTGVVRNALGISCLPLLPPSYQDNASCQRADTALFFKDASFTKGCHASACSDQEQAETGLDFLSLRLSSSPESKSPGTEHSINCSKAMAIGLTAENRLQSPSSSPKEESSTEHKGLCVLTPEHSCTSWQSCGSEKPKAERQPSCSMQSKVTDSDQYLSAADSFYLSLKKSPAAGEEEFLLSSARLTSSSRSSSPIRSVSCRSLLDPGKNFTITEEQLDLSLTLKLSI